MLFRSFLLIYGLSGILSLLIKDTKALEESMMAQAGGNAMMMQQGMGGPGKDFNGVFKAELQNYQILNYKFHLEDVEDAFIAKYKNMKAS